MRAGGQTDGPVVRFELAPAPVPAGTELDYYADDTVDKVLAEARKMLGDVSASVNKAGLKFGGPPPRR